VVPKAVKEEVLQRLLDSGVAFDAVADLCEMSAKRDPMLQKLGDGKQLKIAACYPRAVRWLFAAANAPLPENSKVLNMRVESADQVVSQILAETPAPKEAT
jgi:hypothetical protein